MKEHAREEKQIEEMARQIANSVDLDTLAKDYAAFCEIHRNPYDGEEEEEEVTTPSYSEDDRGWLSMSLANSLYYDYLQYTGTDDIKGYASAEKTVDLLDRLYNPHSIPLEGTEDTGCIDLEGFMPDTDPGSQKNLRVRDVPTSHDPKMLFVKAGDENPWFELDEEDFIVPFEGKAKAYRIIPKQYMYIRAENSAIGIPEFVENLGGRYGYVSKNTKIQVNEHGPVGMVFGEAAVVDSILAEAGYRHTYDETGYSGALGTIAIGGHARVYGSVLQNDKRDSSGPFDIYPRCICVGGNATVIDCRLQGTQVWNNSIVVNAELRNSVIDDSAVVFGSWKNRKTHQKGRFYSAVDRPVIDSTIIDGTSQLVDVSGHMHGATLRVDKPYEQQMSLIRNYKIVHEDLSAYARPGYNTVTIIGK